MRFLTPLLLVLIVLLQYPLWFGKGSWLRVWETGRQLEDQKRLNRDLEARNRWLAAEVTDLKQGFDAIEERARSELGMIRGDEVFFQVLDATARADTAPPAQPAGEGR